MNAAEQFLASLLVYQASVCLGLDGRNVDVDSLSKSMSSYWEHGCAGCEDYERRHAWLEFEWHCRSCQAHSMSH
jgi:hypothetical protein